MKTLNDLTAPVTPVRKLLEKDVQKQCVDWARARGYWARKFSSQSQRSVPDYLFAQNKGFIRPLIFAIEFKALGKTSTKQQQDEQREMATHGWRVWEIDSTEEFKALILRLEQNFAKPV